MNNIIPAEIVENRIFLIRGQKVMLDSHLAELYGTTTGALNQAVKRNKDRFPEDFMFQLDKQETANWISQSVISNPNLKIAMRNRPYVFTEQGVAMLSSVLRSPRAVQVNILIMRTFVKIREMMATHVDLARKIENLEKQYGAHDKDIVVILAAIKKLLKPTQQESEDEKKPPMGFQPPKK